MWMMMDMGVDTRGGVTGKGGIVMKGIGREMQRRNLVVVVVEGENGDENAKGRGRGRGREGKMGRIPLLLRRRVR
jgi:hypothetical protein